jgi:hypothetical protein
MKDLTKKERDILATEVMGWEEKDRNILWSDAFSPDIKVDDCAQLKDAFTKKDKSIEIQTYRRSWFCAVDITYKGFNMVGTTETLEKANTVTSETECLVVCRAILKSLKNIKEQDKDNNE